MSSKYISAYHDLSGSGDFDSQYFNSPDFTEAERNLQNELELYLNKSVPSLDTDRCHKCGSDNIKVTGTYNRGFDEPGNASAKCNNCSNNFVPK